MALPLEVFPLVCPRNALSGRFLHRSGLHVLALGGPRKERGFCAEALKAVSLSAGTQVPASDRYVSTADNQELFTSLVDELE
jgi:hypothetical protein